MHNIPVVFDLLYFSNKVCAIAQMVSCWLLTEDEVQSHASPCGICGGQGGTGTSIFSLPPKSCSIALSVFTPVLHTHSLICHQHYINLAINGIIKEHKHFISNLCLSTLLINL
jgi:hypothetical protein